MPAPLSNFIAELRRRRVFRVAAFYGGIAFVVIQIIDGTFEVMGIPAWVSRLVIIFLVLGFPVSMILAWVFDITDEGIVRTKGHAPVRREPPRPIIGNSALGIVASLAILVAVWSFIGRPGESPTITYEHSIAVMPFDNLTGDEAFDVWSKGMARLVTTKLSGSDELYVLDSQAAFDILDGLTRVKEVVKPAGLNLEAMQSVGERAQVENLVLGEILKAGSRLRLSVRVVVAESGEVLFATQMNGDTEDDLFAMAEGLAQAVRDHLEIAVIEKELAPDFVVGFTSAKAYRIYLDGLEVWISGRPDQEEALTLIEQAWRLDPQPTLATYLIILYHQLRMPDSLASIRAQVEPMLPGLPLIQRHEIMHSIAAAEKDNAEAARHLEVYLNRQPSNRGYWFNLGYLHRLMGQWEKAAKSFEHSLELSRRWNSPFTWPNLYTGLAEVYHELGRHREEPAIYLEALALMPDMAYLYRLLGSSYLELGRAAEAAQALAQMDSLGRQSRVSMSTTFRWRGSAYDGAGFLDSALVYYESALAADSGNADNLNALAELLIDYDLDIDRGVALAEKAVALIPDDVAILDTYGWGLYTQGHNQQALEILEKAYRLAIYVVYSQSQHLSIVRNAVAEGY
jgi:TolB-like protein/Tfp pilus assembly protein PilF